MFTQNIMILVFSIFFGGIFINKSLGIFNVLPKKIEAGQTIKPEEIKGYMTLKEISSALNMNIKDFYKKLSIPENVPENTKLKEVSKYLPDFNTEKAKELLEK